MARGERIEELCETMENVCKRGSRRGVGLASPQVGKAVRLIYVNCRDESGAIRGRFMVNPTITSTATTTNIEREECLSYPKRWKRIARPDWIEVSYLTTGRMPRTLRATGYHARVICHECDHLEGICRVGDDSPGAESPRVNGAVLVAAMAAIGCSSA